MGRIMAFDWGGKRVGVAVTDPLQIIATSLITVETKEVFTFLKKYLTTEIVEKFVVGYPVNHGHRENTVTVFIDQFILELQKQYPHIPVVKMDERFTSKMAAVTLFQSGVNKKARQVKGTLDKISATIILQSFMEMNG